MSLKDTWVGDCKCDLSGSGWGPVVGVHEYQRFLSFNEIREFLNYLKIIVFSRKICSMKVFF